MSEEQICTRIDIINKITNARTRGRLAVLVGAGVSRLSGMPSWSDLIKAMANEIDYHCGDTLGTDDFLKIAQIFYTKCGEVKYKKFVEGQFSHKDQPNSIHDKILDLCPAHILTTNYDTTLEQTAIKKCRRFSVISSNETVRHADNSNYLIKIHGDFSGKFVLREQEYLDYEKEFRLVDVMIKSVIATNLLFVVGYGLNDYNIKLILNWLREAQGEHYEKPIFLNTDGNISETDREYYYSRGIFVLDWNDFIEENMIETNFDDYSQRFSLVLDFLIGEYDSFEKAVLAEKQRLRHEDYLLQTALIKGKSLKSSCQPLLENYAFMQDLEAMESFVKERADNLIDKVRQGFFQGQMCKYWESYELFTDIVSDRKNWKSESAEDSIFFFGQLNRCYMRNRIRFSFTEDDSEKKAMYEHVKREVEFLKVTDFFNEMPYEFRASHPTWRTLPNGDYLREKLSKLSKMKRDTEEYLLSDCVPCSRTDFQILKEEMWFTTAFLYKCHSLLVATDDFKYYATEVLIFWLESAYQERKKLIGGDIRELYMTDIVLIVSCVHVDELRKCLDKIVLKEIPFRAKEEFYHYFRRRVRDFKQQKPPFLRSINKRNEIKTLLLLSSQLLQPEKISVELVDCMNLFGNNELTVTNRLAILDTCLSKEEVWNYAENLIVNALENNDQSLDVGLLLSNIFYVDAQKEGSFLSLSETITRKQGDEILKVYGSQLVCFYQIFTEKAQKALSGYLPNDSISKALLAHKIPHLQKSEEHYIENVLKHIAEGTQRPNIGLVSSRSDLSRISELILNRGLEERFASSYKEGWDEFAFLLLSEFKKEEFNVYWLFDYNENCITRLLEWPQKEEVIVDALYKAMLENKLNRGQCCKALQIMKIVHNKDKEQKEEGV